MHEQKNAQPNDMPKKDTNQPLMLKHKLNIKRLP